jgi:hypothetical protein
MVAALVALLAEAPASGSRVEPQAAAAPAPTAILAGQAVDAVTGAPVANTLIGLSQRAGSGPNTTPTAPNTQLVVVMADSQGRFVVRDVPKGSFLLLATAPGYIVSNYGQARASGPTRTIDLNGDERNVTLKIKLWRHGVISGIVSDEAGEPVVGATVRVLRRAANGPGGERRYLPGTETTTDDRGQYRLTALTPGQFLVTVPQTQVTVPASIIDTYLEGVAARGAAAAGSQLIDLMTSASALPSAGGGVRIDDLLLQSSGNGRLLTIPPPTPGRVSVYPTTVYRDGRRNAASGDRSRTWRRTERRGHHTDAVARRPRLGSGHGRWRGRTQCCGPARGPHRALDPNRKWLRSRRNDDGADGAFTLLGVTPGQYVLKVLRTPRVVLPPSLAANPAIVSTYAPTAPAAPPAGAPPIVGAQVRLTIGDTDIQNLAVPLAPGGSVSDAWSSARRRRHPSSCRRWRSF